MRQLSVSASAANSPINYAGSQSSDSEAVCADCILFLQGPVGPFFSRIAKDFTKRGFKVFKINFNGGDKVFYQGEHATDYEGTPDQWADYLQTFVNKNAISRIYAFGDCRYYHQVAKKIASSSNIKFYVFEEGYVRPNYITLESGGVNGHSRLMHGSALVGNTSPGNDDVVPAGRFCFLLPAFYSIIYYLAASLYSSRFPDYVHHRPLGWLREGAIWIRSGYRKLTSRRGGARVVQKLDVRWQNQYFLCPLQVHCDMQVIVHSPFESIDEFICDVVTSFAKHAPKNHALVFKHHPLDRGYTNYRPLIDQLARALHVDERVFYVHDVCLPSMLRNAVGAVMINSTVGLSSLYHGTPVKVLGDAIYDRKGLTYKGPLANFWNTPGTVDEEAVDRFRSFLKRNNQLNGNLYKRCSNKNASGVVWSGKLAMEHSPDGSVDPLFERRRRSRFVLVKDVNTITTVKSGDRGEGLSKSA
ncbi:MAG: capsule biosynthesis protein [Granulosicoccus sp.]